MVVPSNRPDTMRTFIDEWKHLFREHVQKLFVVWDLDELPDFDWSDLPIAVHTSCRKSVPPFIPTGTDMIRSWGMRLAWGERAPYVLTLDDDVLPGTYTFGAYERAFEEGAVASPFFSVGALTTSKLQMRGFPYAQRKPAKVAIQYGGWDGVLDYDAATQLALQPGHEEFERAVVPVPLGVPVTTCIMNAAWRREYTPIMWQLPMLDGKYNRFGDIWSGLFQKRVLDILGDVMLINGKACVRHKRASNPITNLEREQPGVYYNEHLAGVVFDRDMPVQGAFGARIEEQPLETIYRAVTDWSSAIFPAGYRDFFKHTRDQWLGLFDG